MKITGISTRLIAIDPVERYGGHPVPPGRPAVWHYPLLVIHTDEGIDGYSMGYGPHGDGHSITQNLYEIYLPEIRGENPLHTEAIWNKLMRKGRHLYNMTDSLVSVLDVALWDIKGKAAHLPIATLLGQCRDKMKTYATGWQFNPTHEQVFNEAQKAKSLGYHGYKLQLWHGAKQDIPMLRLAREAVGELFDLMQDANSGYKFQEAVTVGRVLDELRYKWFEEPISDRQLTMLNELGRLLHTPLLTAETVRWVELGEVFRRSRFGMIRGDVHLKAGITGLSKAFGAAAIMGMNLEIHTAATPLLDLANLHVACAYANTELMEHHHPIFRFGLDKAQLAIDEEGYMHLPAGPGLGAIIDWDWLENRTVLIKTSL